MQVATIKINCKFRLPGLISISDGQIQKSGPKSGIHSHAHPCQTNASLAFKVSHYMWHSIALSSRKAYQAGFNSFTNFCSQYGITCIPALSETIRFFWQKKIHHIKEIYS